MGMTDSAFADRSLCRACFHSSREQADPNKVNDTICTGARHQQSSRSRSQIQDGTLGHQERGQDMETLLSHCCTEKVWSPVLGFAPSPNRPKKGELVLQAKKTDWERKPPLNSLEAKPLSTLTKKPPKVPQRARPTRSQTRQHHHTLVGACAPTRRRGDAPEGRERSTLREQCPSLWQAAHEIARV